MAIQSALILNTAKRSIQHTLHVFGLDVKWHVPQPAHAVPTLLNLYEVDTVFDIGANAGMSGGYFRNIGFKGKLVSFEPVNAYYRQLQQRAAEDPLWSTEKIAIGDQNGEQDINVSGGSGGASSFLRTVGHIEENEPDLTVIGQERVKVETLQSVMGRHYPQGDRLFLKIDAQGYEERILKSAGKELDRVIGMRIEVSMVRSYEGEPLICDMLPLLYSLGFKLCGIEEAWSNRLTQEVYQMDAILMRTDRLMPHTS
jgi:FkbM family methyltransferase